MNDLRKFLSETRRSICERIGIGRYSRPALFDLDRRLERYIGKKNGVFIEAGANDGFSQSNTYYLEKIKGWQGILVEPIPALYALAKKRRPRSKVFNCALVPIGRDGEEVEMIYGNLMSLVVGAMGSRDADEEHIARASIYDENAGSYSVKAKGRSLSSIIDETGFGEVDFLSLDVEGFEPQALKGLDLRRHRPTYILVEARYPVEIDNILNEFYMLKENFTGMDRLYCLK